MGSVTVPAGAEAEASGGDGVVRDGTGLSSGSRRASTAPTTSTMTTTKPATSAQMCRAPTKPSTMACEVTVPDELTARSQPTWMPVPSRNPLRTAGKHRDSPNSEARSPTPVSYTHL